MRYVNRKDAGRQLAEALKRFGDEATVVLALPRGGIVLGKEVAERLKTPLGLVLVRKIGHPAHPEYAIGAIVDGEGPVYNEGEKALADNKWLAKAESSARELIERRKNLYYGEDFTPPEVKDKTVIIVDDGIATGFTMMASVMAMRNKGAKKVIAAAPIASRESVIALNKVADELVILDDPGNFLGAVGAHYQEFDQVNDEEVKKLLREVHSELHQAVA